VTYGQITKIQGKESKFANNRTDAVKSSLNCNYVFYVYTYLHT